METHQWERMEPASEAAKVAMQQPEALKFAKRNAFEIPPVALARCVDGRYAPKDAQQAPLSIPGADAGYVLIAFAALRELRLKTAKKNVWEKVVEACGGEGNFRFHTDTHAAHAGKGAGRGCGHLALAADQTRGGQAHYGISPDEMAFLFDQLERLVQKDPAHQVVLQGDHLERAVLVIDSSRYGVTPMEPEDHPGGRPNQTFVFQRTLHGARMEKLAEGLMTISDLASKSITKNDLLNAMKRAFERQLNATLKALAPGDPVYEIQLS